MSDLFPSELLCRSIPSPGDVASPVLRARTASGLEFSLASRDEKRVDLLERARAGEAIELELDIEAFSQFKGIENSNFVRFKPAKLSGFAKSFAGVPFLRDHDQSRLDARAGTVLESKAVAREGGKVFEMSIRITAAWAVEAVLAGNLDRFSIGWAHGGLETIKCSECKCAIFTDCSHFPGDVLENGHTVEFIFTEATGIEVSAVNVPAVAGTGIQEIRAALSQAATAQQTKPEDRHMKKFAQALGLKEDADEQTILAALGAHIAKADQFEAQLSEAATARDGLAAELVTVGAELVELRKTRSDEQVDRLFEDNAGRFPVTRDAAGELTSSPLETQLRKLAAGDFEAADAIVASLPEAVVSPVSTRELQSEKPAPVADQVDGIDPVIASQLKQMGISHEDYLKYNPINGTDRN